MKPNFILKALLFFIILCFSNISYCQTTTTTISASCGKCGKAVSPSSKAGGTCPYCGVRWGRENSTTIKSSTNDNETYINPFALQVNTPAPILPSFEIPSSKKASHETINNLYESSNVIRDCSMRSGSSNRSEVLISLPKNAEITIIARKGYWIKAQYLSSDIKWIRGWIHSSNVVE